MILKEVTKQQFDSFLNYFQDKYIHKSILGETTYFDTFDMSPLAEYRKGLYYVYN